MNDTDPDLMPLLTRRTVSDAASAFTEVSAAARQKIIDFYAELYAELRKLAITLGFKPPRRTEAPARSSMHAAYRAKTRRRRSR